MDNEKKKEKKRKREKKGTKTYKNYPNYPTEVGGKGRGSALKRANKLSLFD